MKQNSGQKISLTESRKAKQTVQQSLNKLQFREQQKLIDQIESQIAQEEVMLSQLKPKQYRKNSTRSIQPAVSPQKQAYCSSMFNFDKNDATFILGDGVNRRAKIVEMAEVKKYEDDAKFKKKKIHLKTEKKSESYLKIQDIGSPKVDKSLKKSLSSSKFVKQRQSLNLQSKNKQKESQEHLESRRLSQLQSPNCSEQKILARQQSSKKNFSLKRPIHLNPLTIPFTFENITYQPSNQLQEIQVNSFKSEGQANQKHLSNSSSKKSLKKKKAHKVTTKSNAILKQLTSSKFLIDAPLDINDFQYSLELQVLLQKNRGFQIYLISPYRKQSNDQNLYFEDVSHFKYEVLRMMPNLLRLRIYLHVQKNLLKLGDKTEQQNPNQDNSMLQDSNQQRQWKIWKQLQLPIFIPEPSQNDNSHLTENPNILKAQITILDLNYVRIKLNQLDFTIKLCHPCAQVCYFCINQDFNGVEFKKINLLGKQQPKVSEEFLSDGCQGKCQLI